MENQAVDAFPPGPKTFRSRFFAVVHGVEKYFLTVIIVALVLIPVVQIILRILKIPGMESILDADKLVQHIVLVLGFLGGMLTTREGQHLSIGLLVDKAKKPLDSVLRCMSATIACAVSTALGLCGLSMMANAFDPGFQISFIPIYVFFVFLPLGYFVMAFRFVTSAKIGVKGKLIALSGVIIGVFAAFPSLIEVIYGKEAIFMDAVPDWIASFHGVWNGVLAALSWPCIILLILSAFIGTPLFIVLGGIALLLFSADFTNIATGTLATVPNAAYVLLTGKDIPAIPLFALIGFILAQSKAGERLMRLFRALLGWFPGGIVIVVVLVSAFFTMFTGGSGITILALGSVLFIALTRQGSYNENFSVGLLTSSGSIGLLFPSLPLIIYGSVAQVSILDMFKGGVIPGILLIVVMAASGVFMSLKNHIKPLKFSLREVLASLKESFWELLIPVIMVVLFVTGQTTTVETSAIVVVYAFLVEVVIKREIRLRDIPGVLVKGMIVVGGVLVIIGTAQAFSEYIIDQQIPMIFADWMKNTLGSPLLFLMLLNIGLLVTGCFMDIYSALIVVVPLIIPLGQAFGIDPVHLGIIFILNMEIGFLTPPVGLNLFLSSYSFQKPIGTIYRSTMPFLLIQIAVLLLVTYVPLLFYG